MRKSCLEGISHTLRGAMGNVEAVADLSEGDAFMTGAGHFCEFE